VARSDLALSWATDRAPLGRRRRGRPHAARRHGLTRLRGIAPIPSARSTG
jgi:hypothetical protein